MSIVAIAAVAIYEALMTEDAPAEEKIAPSYLNPQAATPPAAPPQAPELYLSLPLQTRSYAIVCDQDVIFRALTSRRAQDDFSKVYDAFTSVFGRSEKARAAGCEEWKRGIPVYQAARMQPPFDDFVGFSTSPSGMAEYFTSPAHLENSPSDR